MWVIIEPMINYAVTHHLQPTNSSCSQSSLAMLLSYYGKTYTPQDIMDIVPVGKNEKGEDWGTINQHLATWCLSQGFDVVMYSSDFQVLDLSWSGLKASEIVEKLNAIKGHRDIPVLGKNFSEMYIQSYIDFIQVGGELHIEQCIATPLLDRLIERGPILTCICMSAYYGSGRQADDAGLRQDVTDDIDGKLYNHSIVIHGKDDEGNYLVADPWKTEGFYTVSPEKLVLSIQAAQLECDNLLFQMTPKS